MNASVERGLVAVLREALPGLHVREATCADPLPSDLQMAVVECSSIEHVAGPLHRATVRVWLGTPAFDAGETAHTHSVGRLRTALETAAADSVATAAVFDPACGEASWRGCFVQSVSQDVVDNTWRTTIQAVVGLSAG
ncbi:MAG: hypothetical protein IAE97_07045 [Chthoniobacterales bacterium]|nr:hypothetical protein [Chthoniobacterales bacterium]